MQNTNLYAHSKNEEEGGRQPWKDIGIAHLMICIGIIIYISVHSAKSGSIQNYLRRNDHGPVRR